MVKYESVVPFKVEMLKQVPQIIDSLNTSRLWDLTLFQLESDTHTFGIPGETWCFECDTNFQVISNEIFFKLGPIKIVSEACKFD